MLAISNVGVGYCCIPFARVTFVDILFVGSARDRMQFLYTLSFKYFYTFEGVFCPQACLIQFLELIFKTLLQW